MICILVNCPRSLSAWLGLVFPCGVVLLFDCNADCCRTVDVAIETIVECGIVAMISFLNLTACFAVVFFAKGVIAMSVAISSHVAKLGELLCAGSLLSLAMAANVGVPVLVVWFDGLGENCNSVGEYFKLS